jgi:hypothetical protein
MISTSSWASAVKFGVMLVESSPTSIVVDPLTSLFCCPSKLPEVSQAADWHVACEATRVADYDRPLEELMMLPDDFKPRIVEIYRCLMHSKPTAEEAERSMGHSKSEVGMTGVFGRKGNPQTYCGTWRFKG